GQQHVVRRLAQREVVTRDGALDLVPDLQPIVYLDGAAAAGFLPQDTDGVSAAGRRVPTQRVLPAKAGGQMQLQVRTRLPWGEIGAVGRREFQRHDVLCQWSLPLQSQLQRRAAQNGHGSVFLLGRARVREASAEQTGPGVRWPTGIRSATAP